MVNSQRLVLAGDAKRRIKWSRQLHEQFVEAVSRLGGAEKATPKSVMQMMAAGTPGLSLHHIKTHLQRYRHAASRGSEALCTCAVDGENLGEQRRAAGAAAAAGCSAGDGRAPPENICADQSTIESTMQVRVEEQRKFNEEIERHLQLRIEAQEKYLRCVLRRAQEALARYSLDRLDDPEAAGVELSELASAATAQCLSSSASGSGGSASPPQCAGCSADRCLAPPGAR